MDQPVVIQQPDRPQMTIEVPAGWEARENKRQLILTRDGRRVVVRQCTLDREERDLRGRTGRNRVPVRGGGCLIVSRGAPKLNAQLGQGKLPASNAEAQRLAREARTKTLRAPRATGTMRAITPREPLDATWTWDLPARYFHMTGTYASGRFELLRHAGGHRTRPTFSGDCWGYTVPAAEDDVADPRLELEELDAPPRRSTTWRLAYQAPRRLPDGSIFLRWDAFVHDGEAVVGPDGHLRSVRIRDHGQAEARAPWSALDLAFTGFPAAVEPVRPEPSC